MKEVVDGGRRADRPLRRLHRGRAGARRSCARLPGPVGGQDRRAGRRQGRARHRVARRGRAPTCGPSCRARRSATPGARVVIEEGLTGPELSVLARVRRHAGGARSRRRRTSSGSATATPARTPAAWAPTRRCRASTTTLVDDVMDRVRRAHAGRAAPPGHRLPRRALRRADAHARRARRCVEYNVRFGDPEAQVVLPRLTTDLAELLAAAAAGDLVERRRRRSSTTPRVHRRAAPAEGYPAAPRTGDVIDGHRRRRAPPGVDRVLRRASAAGRRRRAGHRRRPGARRDGAGPDASPPPASRAYRAVGRISLARHAPPHRHRRRRRQRTDGTA